MARYAADRARRQYQLAEPENRLVVRQLEKDWEQALADQARLEAEHQRFTEARPAALTADERQAIRSLATNLPFLWTDARVTTTERKELLHILIEKITVAVVGDSERVDVTITWSGGHETHSQATRPVQRYEQLSYFPQLRERLAELADAGLNVGQITDRLNTEGFRPPKRPPRFTSGQVGHLLRECHIRVPGHRRTPAPVLAANEWMWSAWPTNSACPPTPSTRGSTAAGSPPANPTTPAVHDPVFDAALRTVWGETK